MSFLTTSASAIVEKGKAQGMSLTKGYVHTIRSKARVAPPKDPPSRPASSSTAASSHRSAPVPLEARYVDLVLELGLVRAEALLGDLRKTVAAAIG
jgi:hypothetical protein